MFALATVEAAVFNIAYLVGIPTPEHLVDEAIIVARMVTRIDACEPVPVLDKDLFEDVPVLCRGCHHQGAPSGGNGMVAVQLFYHTSPVLSTLSSAFSGAHPPPLFPLSHGDARTAEKCKFLLCGRCCQAPLHIFSSLSSFFKGCVTEGILGLPRCL